MSLLELETDREMNPVDMIEQVASVNDWDFERSGDDEINVTVGGLWSDYSVSFSWMEDFEALHLACAFDLKVPERRNAETVKLLSLVNEQLLVMSEEGDLVLVAADPARFQEITRLTVLPGARVWNPHVLADGIVYVRDDKQMAAYNLKP